MGLFGYDLTSFLDYCWISYEDDYNNCDYYSIANYFDGWAQGAHWQMPDYEATYEHFTELWEDVYAFVCINESCHGTMFDKSCYDGSSAYECVQGYVYCSETPYTVTALLPATVSDLTFRKCEYYYHYGFNT